MPVRPARPSAPGSLFEETPPAPRSNTGAVITAHCDGGARGNPGPAGYGVEVTDPTGAVVAELSEFLGICTNNVAEYSGLLASLQYALDHGHPALRVISDSELMVKQIQGKYKVNSPDLKPLWQTAKQRIAQLKSFEITHALRHKNKAADRLANEAMDRGMARGTPAEGQPTVRGMRQGTPAEGRSLVRSGTDPASPGIPGRAGVQSLPLRAIPYPQTTTAPPTPAKLDPAPRLSPPPLAQPATEAPPAMLRGFTRDGVIHLLGNHTLPDGRFVKIIPE